MAFFAKIIHSGRHMDQKNIHKGAIHKVRHPRWGGEGVRQKVTWGDMRGGGGHQKVTSSLNVKIMHDFLKEKKNNEYMEDSSV